MVGACNGAGRAGRGALRGDAARCRSLGRWHGTGVYAVPVSGPHVLVIDSYDSFVYNLVQYLGELGAEPSVVRNDELTVDQALALQPDAVLLSPGPGRPEDAGIICAAIPAFAERGVPVLGVCLGHQAIGHVYGASVVRAPQLMHGKTSSIVHHGVGVFAGLPNPLVATRYHSLVIDPATMPDCLEVTASTDDGIIMGVRHRSLPVEGVQFHPESILTVAGHDLLANFLSAVTAR
jgi:anthranilate synthase/aminodeoxychorismate synthase-like glutamine amidotransferase